MDLDDIDQNLLLQFSCMGTTDKDELVKQFLTLVGYQHNSNAASFFLEMNNWNLQEAIGSYFDVHSLKLPSMSIVSGIAESENWVLPNSKFVKSWEVQNTGDEAWPPDCRFRFTGGRCMADKDLPVGPLQPGCRATICIEMTAPAELGIFESLWRMSTSSGSYFGEAIWVIVTVRNEPPCEHHHQSGPVSEQSLNGLAHQLSALTPLGSSPRPIPVTSNPFYQLSSSQPKSQNDSQASMDEDGNMLCYGEIE